MKFFRYLAVIAGLLAGLSLAACSPKTTEDPDWNPAAANESRWSATYTDAGESVPLTLILMTAENSGRARLVALSAFGATLGDCWVQNGRGQCRSPRGAEGLMTRVSGAIGAMLDLDSDFLLKPGRGPDQIGTLGWQARRDASGAIEYRLATSSSWALVTKRVAVK